MGSPLLFCLNVKWRIVQWQWQIIEGKTQSICGHCHTLDLFYACQKSSVHSCVWATKYVITNVEAWTRYQNLAPPVFVGFFLQSTIFGELTHWDYSNQLVCRIPNAGINGEGAFQNGGLYGHQNARIMLNNFTPSHLAT